MATGISERRPLARSLIYKSKKYRQTRKAFRGVAGAIWLASALLVFYKNQLQNFESIQPADGDHHQADAEQPHSTHSRVRRSSSTKTDPNKLNTKDLPNWPYDPDYVNACKERLPRDRYDEGNKDQVRYWNNFFDRNRDIYKERHHFEKYRVQDSETNELTPEGQTLCCLEEQDKKHHHQGAKSEFPKVGIFTDTELKSGAFLIHLMVSLYMFAALAIVCDDYFVPALERVSEELQLSEDVAGATFMAAGSSAPELFTSMIGVFVAKSDIGIGTIVGSAVFNILVIIGACGLFVGEEIPLSVWPLFRDSCFYLITIICLLVVIFPDWDHDACPEWRNKDLYECNNVKKFDDDRAKWNKNCECRTKDMYVDTLYTNDSGTQMGYWTCTKWETIKDANCSNPREQAELNPETKLPKMQQIKDGDNKKNVPIYQNYYAEDFLVQTQTDGQTQKEIGRCECVEHLKEAFKDCHDWSPTIKQLKDIGYNCSDITGRTREPDTYMKSCECHSYKGINRYQLLNGDVALCGKSEVFFYEALVMLIMYSFYIIIMKYNEDLEAIFSAKTGIKRNKSDAQNSEEVVPLNERMEQGAVQATPLLEKNYNNNNNRDLSATCELDQCDQTHVEEMVAREHEHVKPNIDFDEAGMRVMMTTDFAPKTRLRTAAKLLANKQENLVLAKETQDDGTVKTVLIQKKSHGTKHPDLDGIELQNPNSNNNNNNYNNNNNSDACSEGPNSDGSGDDGDDDEGPTHPFELPGEGFTATMKFLIGWPITAALYFTVPQCAKKEFRHLYIVSFVMSTVWIAFYSYIMVWMVAYCGYALGIPDTIMGLTFLAAGTSVPDTIASVLVAKQGMGDMAVSNSIGSNVFDILLGLALPWAAQMCIAHVVPPPDCKNLAKFTPTVVINSRGLVISVTLLLLSLVFVVSTIHCNGWKLNTRAGVLIGCAYVVFIMGSIYNEGRAADQTEDVTCARGLRKLNLGW